MKALEFEYTNWRGVRATRRVFPDAVRWGVTEWHPKPQWLMSAWDADKGVAREFAMKDMENIREVAHEAE